VFLGYCSAASDLAGTLLTFVEDDVGATVPDWQRDFKPGRSILVEIEEARLRCTTGVFLFTKDDPLNDETSGNQLLLEITSCSSRATSRAQKARVAS
jgi:hypothetical protein